MNVETERPTPCASIPGNASFTSANPHLDVAPEKDSLLIFPSWALHEVMPVVCPSGEFADSRFSVNCWVWRTLPSEV